MLEKLVNAPALSPRQHSIVDSGNRVDDGDSSWENGVTFTPKGCYPVDAMPEVGCKSGQAGGAMGADKPPARQCVPAAVFKPYLLIEQIDWSAADRGFDPKDLAIESLELGTASRLEAMMSNTPGTIGRPVLDDAQFTGTATDVRYAAGLVESMLSDSAQVTGAGITLLINPAIAWPLMAEAELRDGQIYSRTTGAQIIVGDFSPANTVYGVVGEVDVYLSEIFVTEYPDAIRVSNQVLALAERLAMAVWNPCAVAAVSVEPPPFSLG